MYWNNILRYIGLIKHITKINFTSFFFNVTMRKFKITHVAYIHNSHYISTGQHWSRI